MTKRYITTGLRYGGNVGSQSMLKGILYAEQDGICAYCGCEMNPIRVTLDHVIPVSQGGGNDRNNLVACCHKCNASKNAYTPEEWKEAMKEAVIARLRDADLRVNRFDGLNWISNEDYQRVSNLITTVMTEVEGLELTFFYESDGFDVGDML